MGYWREEGANLGPQIDQKHLDRILNYVKLGKEEGATLVTGGYHIDRPGYFMQPAIFTDVTPDMRIMKEEIFGPVMKI